MKRSSGRLVIMLIIVVMFIVVLFLGIIYPGIPLYLGVFSTSSKTNSSYYKYRDVIIERMKLSLAYGLDAIEKLDEKILGQLEEIRKLNITIKEFKDKYPENFTRFMKNLELSVDILESLQHISYALYLAEDNESYKIGSEIVEMLHAIRNDLYWEINYCLMENPSNFSIYRLEAYLLYLDTLKIIHQKYSVLENFYYKFTPHSTVRIDELKTIHNLLVAFRNKVQDYASIKAYGHPVTTTPPITTTIRT